VESGNKPGHKRPGGTSTMQATLGDTTGSRRADGLIAIFELYDSTGMLDEIAPLVKQIETVKDDHPRYGGCFKEFMSDFMTVIRNAQSENDDVVEALEQWLQMSIKEIDAALQH